MVSHLLIMLLHETRGPIIVLRSPPLDSVPIHLNPDHSVTQCIPYLQPRKAPQVIGHTRYFCGFITVYFSVGKIQDDFWRLFRKTMRLMRQEKRYFMAVAQIFQTSKRHIRILGSRRVIRRGFHNTRSTILE